MGLVKSSCISRVGTFEISGELDVLGERPKHYPQYIIIALLRRSRLTIRGFANNNQRALAPHSLVGDRHPTNHLNLMGYWWAIATTNHLNSPRRRASFL